MDIAGMGSDALRRIAVDARYRIDLAALREAIGRIAGPALRHF